MRFWHRHYPRYILRYPACDVGEVEMYECRHGRQCGDRRWRRRLPATYSIIVKDLSRS